MNVIKRKVDFICNLKPLLKGMYINQTLETHRFMSILGVYPNYDEFVKRKYFFGTTSSRTKAQIPLPTIEDRFIEQPSKYMRHSNYLFHVFVM